MHEDAPVWASVDPVEAMLAGAVIVLRMGLNGPKAKVEVSIYQLSLQ